MRLIIADCPFPACSLFVCMDKQANAFITHEISSSLGNAYYILLRSRYSSGVVRMTLGLGIGKEGRWMLFPGGP